jgi:hypothetical protein
LKCGVFRANWLPITAHGRRNPRDSGLWFLIPWRTFSWRIAIRQSNSDPNPTFKFKEPQWAQSDSNTLKYCAHLTDYGKSELWEDQKEMIQHSSGPNRTVVSGPCVNCSIDSRTAQLTSLVLGILRKSTLYRTTFW